MPSSSELDLFKKAAIQAISAEELLSAALQGIKAAIAACDTLSQLQELEERLDRLGTPDSKTRQRLASKRTTLTETATNRTRKRGCRAVA